MSTEINVPHRAIRVEKSGHQIRYHGPEWQKLTTEDKTRLIIECYEAGPASNASIAQLLHAPSGAAVGGHILRYRTHFPEWVLIFRRKAKARRTIRNDDWKRTRGVGSRSSGSQVVEPISPVVAVPEPSSILEVKPEEISRPSVDPVGWCTKLIAAGKTFEMCGEYTGNKKCKRCPQHR